MASPRDVFQSIMTRLGCARMILLRSFGRGEHPTVMELVSRTQKDAIKDAMGRSPKLMARLDHEERAKMVSLLTNCRFSDDHLQELLAIAAPHKQPRLPSQKFFPNILGYFLQSEWDKMAEGRNIVGVMDTVVNRLLELGGRNMSEPCAASLLATILFTVGCKGLDDSSKNKLLQFFKLDYKRKARRCPKVDPILEGPSIAPRVDAAVASPLQECLRQRAPCAIPNRCERLANCALQVQQQVCPRDCSDREGVGHEPELWSSNGSAPESGDDAAEPAGAHASQSQSLGSSSWLATPGPCKSGTTPNYEPIGSP